MRLRLAAGAAVAVGAVLSSTVLIAPSATAAPTGRNAAQALAAPAGSNNAPAASTIRWAPCGTEEVAAARQRATRPGGRLRAAAAATKLECATIKVPVDWAKPNGPRFDLALARATATDPAKRIGSLLVNPGGPGGSGVEFALGADYAFSPELRKHFDVVGFDPRGVGRSHPAVCDLDVLEQAVSEHPRNQAEFAKLLAYHQKLGKDCRKQTGPLFDHVDTTSVVRDMEAIRVALGEPKISYYGVSYGTQIGQQYAELYPGRIRAMTIDSNMDHSLSNPLQYLYTSNIAFEGSVKQFAKWCERTAECVLYGKDVLKHWDALYAKAEKGTLRDPQSGQKVTPENLRATAFSSMYDPTEWWFFAEYLAVLSGDLPPSVAAAAGGSPAAKPVHGDLVPNPYQAIWCEDWRWKISGYRELNGYRQALAKVTPHTRLSEWWTDVTSCLGWPARVNNPQHRLKITGAPPILMTNSKFDVATPMGWATNAAKQIPSAVFLTYDGVGHGDYWLSPCARAAIDTYLITLKTPAAGTHCPAVWPQDETAAARSAAPYYPLRPAIGATPAERPTHQ